MKLFLLVGVLILVGGLAIIWWGAQDNPYGDAQEGVFADNENLGNNANKMVVLSPAFKEGERIPAKYTCEGGDINPELHVQGVPDGAKGLVLIMDDPDAPMGTWLHWTAWNIDPKTAVIKEDSVPAGSVEGTTSFGKPGYGGPCPPSGTHRYYFRLYALDAVLGLKAGASRGELERAIAGHILAQAELMGTYKR